MTQLPTTTEWSFACYQRGEKKSVAGCATLNSPKEDGGIVSVSVRSSSPDLTRIQPLKHLIQYVGELLFTNKVKKSNSVATYIFTSILLFKTIGYNLSRC